MNTNSNSNLSITDVYLIYKKINGSPWPNGTPFYRIFTQSEWNVINTSNNNLLSTYPGIQTVTLDNPIAGGSSTFYIIKTGHSN
jgi:hypothetical protein